MKFLIGFGAGVLATMIYGMIQYLRMTARDWTQLKQDLDEVFGPLRGEGNYSPNGSKVSYPSQVVSPLREAERG